MCQVKARRCQPDEGAVLVIVAIFFAAGVIFSLLALVVDVGGMLGERRESQNAADSASFALAQRCAFDDSECSFDAEAQALANANSRDGVTDITEVCGWAASYWTRAQRLGACGPSTSPVVNDCQPVDTSAYPNVVRVRTYTLTSAGDSEYPSIFGGVFAGEQQGLASGACSQTAWGVPSRAVVALPFLLPICPGNLTTGPFELLDFYSNEPTQDCGDFTDVTLGWALGDIYGDGATCETGVAISVGQRVMFQPSTTHMCGDPNEVDTVSSILAEHIGVSNVVPVVGEVECTDLDKNGNPKKNCGIGNYQFTVVGFKSFVILGFKMHNAEAVGQAPASGWNPECSRSRDCIHGRLGTDIAVGDIDPANPDPDLDFGVRIIAPLP